MVVQYTRAGFYENEVRTKLTDLSAPLVKIGHTPLPNTENDLTPYTATADIRTSGNLLDSSLKIYWNTDGGSVFNESPLIHQAGSIYTGEIPAQMVGTTVYYYLHAEADNGYQRNEPFDAPATLHTFDVMVDTAPPDIQHDPIAQWRADMWAPELSAVVTDDLAVAEVYVQYEINGSNMPDESMTMGSDGVYRAELGGSVAVGDEVTYRIVAVDGAQVPNTSYHPVTGSHILNVTDPLPALVIDLDGNTNSGPTIHSLLQTLGVASEYRTDLPEYVTLYETVWVCLGVQPNNAVLSFDDSMVLYDYLMKGGNAYVESADMWANDPRYPFMFEFGIGSLGQGEGDAGPIAGEPGAFTEGLLFQYDGDNNNIDRLKAKGTGQGILNNTDPEYVCGVISDSGTYKTIGLSVEFGGLSDGTLPNTKAYLLQHFTAYFGLTDPPVAPTPTPTDTPTPTPTPPCPALGVELHMPSTDFYPGDPCSCTVTVCNPGEVTYTNIPLFVILDVYGDMFFWPSFSEFDYREISVGPGANDISVLPEFPWPAGAGDVQNIYWYAGMTDPGMSGLFGDMDMWTFGWHNN